MKIGVFGDSYAHADQKPIWWRYLADLGHDVTCHGEPGSSIMFSVDRLQEHATRYELAIWCATMPGRLSFPTPYGAPWPRTWQHWRVTEPIVSQDARVRRKQEIYRDYYLEHVDLEQDNFVNSAIIHHVMRTWPNVMVIPCFFPPLKLQFNLYDISCWEIRPFFDSDDACRAWHDHYLDARSGHLIPENHQKLAQLINNNLCPGIFQTDIEKFAQATSLQGVLVKR